MSKKMTSQKKGKKSNQCHITNPYFLVSVPEDQQAKTHSVTKLFWYNTLLRITVQLKFILLGRGFRPTWEYYCVGTDVSKISSVRYYSYGGQKPLPSKISFK